MSLSLVFWVTVVAVFCSIGLEWVSIRQTLGRTSERCADWMRFCLMWIPVEVGLLIQDWVNARPMDQEILAWLIVDSIVLALCVVAVRRR